MSSPAREPSDPLFGNRLSGLLGAAMETAQPDSQAVPDKWEPPSPEHIAVLLPQYRIEHLIGRGGMGAVYKGRQITLNRPVAIKILPAELARNREFVARFHREAQLLASLSHQGIVTIFDFGQTTEGHLYFVMEFVDGTDLHRLIHKTKLDAEQALKLTIQICEALQYAHDMGVIHRDIKPANVLVTRDGRAKLADFGLALKPAEHGLDVPEPPQPADFDPHDPMGIAALRITKPGTAMGTPDYAAPEVYDGKADSRSDIYALGIMLYEMLTGAPPKGYYQLPSSKAKVDVRIDRVVVKALDPDPSARYQKASDMRLAVENATKPLPAKAPATPPRQPRAQAPRSREKPQVLIKPASSPRQYQPKTAPAPTQRKKRPSFASVLAVAAIAGLAVGGWLLFFRSTQPHIPSSNENASHEPAVLPEFMPSKDEKWIDGLAAYWAGDWKDDSAFAREEGNSVRALRDKAIFWPLNPKTKPMRDMAVRVLWRWPEPATPPGNRPEIEGLLVHFRASMEFGHKGDSQPLKAGYYCGVTFVNRGSTSKPGDCSVVALDSKGVPFGDGGPLRQFDRTKSHIYEVRAVGTAISFRLDGDTKVLAHDWNGDYYQRGQATEGLIQALLPQGAIIDRFEYAHLGKEEAAPVIPSSVSSPTSVASVNSAKPMEIPVPFTPPDPAAAAPKPIADLSSDRVTRRLADIEQQFDAARDREARKTVDEQIVALTKSYLTSGLGNAIADARRRDQPVETAALEKERDAFLASKVVRAVDEQAPHEAVKRLRKVFWDTRARYEADINNLPVPAPLYQGYQSELKKALGDFTGPDRDRVLNRYNEIVGKAGFSTWATDGMTPAWKRRCDVSMRNESVRQSGGTAEGEMAVTQGLAFLKKIQNADGSWGTTDKAGATALALLAFLGRCETADSVYSGDTILKSLLFLIETAKKSPDGIVSAVLRSPRAAVEHAMAIQALGEAYMTAQWGSKTIPGLRETFEKGVAVIVRKQLPSGGWAGDGNGLAFRTDGGSGDPFTTVWQCAALHTAYMTRLKLDGISQSRDKALGYLLGIQTGEGGFGIPNGGPSSHPVSMTGASIFTLEMLPRSRRTEREKGARYLIAEITKQPASWDQVDLHSWFFNTAAFARNGGERWKAWNERMLPLLLSKRSLDGHWQRPSNLLGGSEADSTALCVLMLENYYRGPHHLDERREQK